jgi:hypothetical protein
MEREIWRPAPEFEGWYEVSSLGRVRRSRPGKATFVGKVLRPGSRRKNGYKTVYLRRRGDDKQREVHRLVAGAFIGPCPTGKEVNHLDGNPANNRAENLEYCTRAENVQHAYRMGLTSPSHGEHHHMAKLTTDQVIIIRMCSAPASVLARALGVSRPAIRAIKKLRNWKHV